MAIVDTTIVEQQLDPHGCCQGLEMALLLLAPADIENGKSIEAAGQLRRGRDLDREGQARFECLQLIPERLLARFCCRSGFPITASFLRKTLQARFECGAPPAFSTDAALEIAHDRGKRRVLG